MLFLIRMMRPGNAIMAGASVLLGAWVAGADLRSAAYWLDAFAMALLAAGGNLHNDLIDLPIDRINRPDRPLPAGRVAPVAVLWATAACGALALAIGLLRGFPHLVYFLIVLEVLYLYNRFWKGKAHIGNLAVSALCASALALPLLQQGLPHPGQLVPLIAFAFLFTWPREIIKDMEDIEGDRVANLATFPIVSGLEKARAMAIMLTGIACLSPVVPVFLEIYPSRFVVWCTIFVLPLGIMAVIQLRKSQNSLRKAQKMLKFAMLGGFLALVASMK